MRLFLLFLLFTFKVNASDCINLPYGEVKTVNENIVKLCHNAYTAYFDSKENYTANISYVLTADHGISCGPRKDVFKKDPDIKNSPTPSDYDKSGFDRGHLTPYLDNAWDQTVGDESFFMTNMAPQYPGLNRGIWKTLESDVRAWADQRKHDLVIYVGSIHTSTDKKIGTTHVDIPESFYKVIVDTTTKETLAFIFPNVQKLSDNLAEYQVTVDDIEKKTMLEIPVPNSKIEKSELWFADLNKYSKEKLIKCKK